MANFFYPRTIEVGGNLSGSGLAENPTGLKPSINITSADVSSYISSSDLHVSNNLEVEGNTEVNTLSASNGLSSSFFYGDGTNIINVNPNNIDFSDLLSDISSSFGENVNISSSFGLKTDISSSFARLLKTESQTFSGPITASSFLGNNDSKINGKLELLKENDVYIKVNDTHSSMLLGCLNGSGYVGTETNDEFEIITNDAERMVIKADGKIGIGNNVPKVHLSIGPTANDKLDNYELLQLSNTNDDNAYMTVRSNQATGYFGAVQDKIFIGSQTSDKFVLAAAGGDRICLASNGKIGIGDNFYTPDELLHINGNLKVNNDLIVGNDYDVPSNALIYADNNNFNVGVGTSNPDSSKRLHVVGESKFNGNMTLSGSLLLQSGNGISFAAFSDASGMTSELLDDYEEGTWTPTLNNFGATTAFDAKYIKIGSLVQVWCRVQATSADVDINETAYITGLPYFASVVQPSFISCYKNGAAGSTVLSARVISSGLYVESDVQASQTAYYVFASYTV